MKKHRKSVTTVRTPEVGLAIPLTPSQLRAAQRLHKQMKQWQAADSALKLVSQRFSGFDRDASLVKVVCLNGLYGTNLYAIHRMAAHIAKVMTVADPVEDPAELVERMARLPRLKGEATQRRHLSFSSKFCHFFIDAKRFPIMDRFAVLALRRHLGRGNLIRNSAAPYRAFTQNIDTLLRLSGVTATRRELDCYLWIAGAYHSHERNPDTALNADLDEMMKSRALRTDLLSVAGSHTWRSTA